MTALQLLISTLRARMIAENPAASQVGTNAAAAVRALDEVVRLLKQEGEAT